MGVATFRRYTNLAATIHLLQTRSITLLNPATWDDTNDAYYMVEYKRYTNAKSVLALCFTECMETYHHWRVFSHGSDGVCIEFDKDRLMKIWADDPSVRTGYVAYREIKVQRANGLLTVDELPFLKRFPYQDEQEFQAVYTGMDEPAEFKGFPISLSCIRRITLSPWLSSALVESVKTTLKRIPGCEFSKVYRSTLVDNEAWKKFTATVGQ
jgi:hypothetical protein